METNQKIVKDIKKIFVRFLKEYGVEEDFKKILKVSDDLEFNKYLEGMYPDCFISYIFLLLDTPEQAKFWVKVDEDWLKILEMYKKLAEEEKQLIRFFSSKLFVK